MEKPEEIITHIFKDSVDNFMSCWSNDVKDPASIGQELINIIIRSIALKPLEGSAKESCQKGHEMESIYSKQLFSGDCPWGVVEEISQVGLAQKIGMKHMKASVDRIVGITNNVGEKHLLLSEFKAHAKPETSRPEEYRIDELRTNGLLEEDSIFCEVESDDPDSFRFIPKEQEGC